jgi:hypothetical protein
MLKILRNSLIVLSFLCVAENGLSWDCMTDCDHFIDRPWWRRGHASRAACLARKSATCKFHKNLVAFFSPRVKPHLFKHFNNTKWLKAVANDRETEYMTQCIAAGVAACGAAAATLGSGNPWAAAVGGGVGVFVSTQICHQSKSW